MKEEILQKAIEYLNTLEAFAVEQSPIFIQELLNYHLVVNIALLAGSMVCGIIAYKCTAKAIKLDKKDGYEDENEMVVATIIAVIAFILCFAFLALSSDIIKLIFAPRLFLMEEVSRLL